MLTVKEAARIGINACIDKIGRDFVWKNRNHGSSAYGKCEEGVYCFVGVSNKERKPMPEGVIILDNTSKFPYMAKCVVDLEHGIPRFCECVLPQ